MLNIEKKYIVDENNNRIAVEIDIETYNRIEDILENFGLFRLMEETAADDSLDLEAAEKYYKSLKKNDD